MCCTLFKIKNITQESGIGIVNPVDFTQNVTANIKTRQWGTIQSCLQNITSVMRRKPKTYCPIYVGQQAVEIVRSMPFAKSARQISKEKHLLHMQKKREKKAEKKKEKKQKAKRKMQKMEEGNKKRKSDQADGASRPKRKKVRYE
eukprot:TRINITY_DN555_c0_g2_i2.p1 TRINITY_DN555_c0_g2~~TRINITY_DN555_c0_g2_i2.p1  ORF type:complete len:145 (+),score=35.42 TRINITY_DN555_c0_g2_i2:71-505(+)